MGLKDDIVVVNEYSIRNKGKGIKGGSRGGTPGNYILRYMAREDATEIAAPVTVDHEDYILRYMARRDATETLDSEKEIKRSIRRNQRLGGIAFSGESLSLSHTELVSSSKAIQDAFMQGKTVMKTVISFREEYLRNNKIIPEDFIYRKKGDYKGNIDQMKLRHAISHGMDYLARDFDDLKYVGAIQVDTGHIHCHLAMVDMGEGKITEDGTQKGKLTAASMAKLRRGIDLALDSTKEIQYMASSVGIDKRNVQTNMKKYTYNQILMYGAPQRIMSELPEDESMWRAGSNRKEMKKANRICRDYVEQILKRPGSGFEDAMQSVSDYALARRMREELDEEEEERLIRNGRNDIIKGCMNSVYATLRQIPEERRIAATPFLNMVSAPKVTPSFRNDVQDMVYRMTAYHSRYDRHRNEAKKYSGFVADYEKAQAEGNTAPASIALYRYFLIEQEYQAKLTSKYSHFLFFEEPSDELAEEYMELMKKANTLQGMRLLVADPSVRKMKLENAERYARERYDVYGGRYAVSEPEKFLERMKKFEKSYHADDNAFRVRLQASNLSLEKDDRGRTVVIRKKRYDFNDVKGLDLHDIRGDFNKPLCFGEKVRKTYMEMAERRIKSFDEACAYLDSTGQGELKQVFDGEDIDAMRRTSETLKNHGSISPAKLPAMAYEDKSVIRVDKKMHQYIRDMIAENVAGISAEYRHEDEHTRV